jgi:hypothetical protein
VSQVDDGPPVNIGAAPGTTEITLRILRKLGVPDNAIELLGNKNKTTWDETVALKGWAKSHAILALIVPTEVFSARRTRWILQHEFSDTNIHIEVPSFDPPRGYSKTEWWKTDEGVIAFQNEVIKYLYYRLKY